MAFMKWQKDTKVKFTVWDGGIVEQVMPAKCKLFIGGGNYSGLNFI